mmetsp:Transcript_157/g.395  ORF Transcript_157/g.395 Transcript_157/m.395 type:complete len:256 (+) Transcript_157:1372-2139(+)
MTGDFSDDALWQTSWQVLEEPATGDMRQTIQQTSLEEGKATLDVDLGGREERSANGRGTGIPRALAFVSKLLLLQKLPDEAEAIAVNAAARKAKQNIAGTDILGENSISVDSTDAEPGKVVVSGGIHRGHLSGFAADETTTSLSASFGDALDNRRCFLDRQISGGIVIKEEERLSAGNDKIIDAHGDQINADAIVTLGRLGDAELGTDAVGSANQNRIGTVESCGGKVKETSETAKVCVTTCTSSALAVGLDHFN